MAKEREPYEVVITRQAVKSLRKLSDDKSRIKHSLKDEAQRLANPGSRGGKTTKALRGTRESFIRLRVGDLRLIYDRDDSERVLVVLDVVNRRDLERRLKSL